ncbi:2Fe-2S iron-sulfur cluster binding domain-containing protein [Sphingomonas ginsenosidivorax]|uniref:2Fe-2S iron-sulfur cluster binding domain-containing protein n=1 Tax=Sphingomonas ginsenosidivorax TaxID=862135 RepID=A0A5C6UFX9_9SPHN|nr:2Fe-2S iron-sulfur cluster-binding protein [Sphingomonas ginsenosidivorax]TXC71066.1 2Fe-2S iron-sulfur cluster binding domain-containing protein [Sphingomonas ginsenosidivorax]
MSKLIVTTLEGEIRELLAASGLSVMEIIRDAGIDELRALCGGCLSCATCHVIVDPADLDRLAPMSDEEAELLADLSTRTPTSRLSCQIPFDETLDSLRVAVADAA